MRKGPSVKSPAAQTLTYYAAILRRSWWVIVTVFLLAVIGGGVYTVLASPVYESQSSVLVLPSEFDTSVTGARTSGEVNLDTEAQLVSSTEIARMAAESMAEEGHHLPESPQLLAERVYVQVPPNTSVLEISFQAEEPDLAHAGTVAFSQAYLDYRETSARNQILAEAETVEERVEDLQDESDELSSRLSSMAEENPERGQVESNRDSLNSQISELNGEVSALESAAAAVSPGRVISTAVEPTSPVSPNAILNLVAAGTVGLLLGVSLAWARQLFARRLWHLSDLEQKCDLPALASVPRNVKFPRREIFGAYGPGGRTMGQISTAITSQLRGSEKVIVVLGVSPGPTASIVTGNVGAALARSGEQTAVVAGYPSTTVGLDELLDARGTPGLSDVWAKRVDLLDSMFEAGRQEGLSVIGPGSASSTVGPTSDLVVQTFNRLRSLHRYVLVEAPPLSCSSDGQLLASHADAVIVTAQQGNDRIKDIQETVTLLRQFGVDLLGAVVFGPQLGAMSETAVPGSDYAREADDIDPPAQEPPRARGVAPGSLASLGFGEETPDQRRSSEFDAKREGARPSPAPHSEQWPLTSDRP